jgi:hypothetical protein
MYVAAKATDDAEGNNLRSVIVSATTPYPTTVPSLEPAALFSQLAALLALGSLALRSRPR